MRQWLNCRIKVPVGHPKRDSIRKIEKVYDSEVYLRRQLWKNHDDKSVVVLSGSSTTCNSRSKICLERRGHSWPDKGKIWKRLCL